MKIKLSDNDLKKIKIIADNQILNNDIIDLYVRYLENPCFINSQMVNEFSKENNLSLEYSFYLLFISYFEEYHFINQKLINDYIKPSLKLLDKTTYLNNPYYKNIKIPNVSTTRWNFKNEVYKPYEVFVYKDIDIFDNYKETPYLGYFTEEFNYMSIEEDGHEWMAIKPNEIETMKEPIEEVKGNIITFGLGMGYFAYMTSLKDEVKNITIVDDDKELIELFKKHLLPQFKYIDKIKIVKADAFAYASHMQDFDYAFVDLWHDVSDGLELYIRMKAIEKDIKGIKFLYWIEKSLLSYLRKDVFIVILNRINNKEPRGNEIIKKIDSIMDISINNYEEVLYYLSDEYLKILASKIII